MIRRTSVVLALTLALAASPSAQQEKPTGTFRYERAVSGAAAQPQRLSVDVPLLS
jgi:hypothetical protein